MKYKHGYYNKPIPIPRFSINIQYSDSAFDDHCVHVKIIFTNYTIIIIKMY